MNITALIAVLSFLAHPVLFADPSPRDIVARSIANYENDWKAVLDFTYMERDVSEDSSGRPKTGELSEVNVVDGTPYSRLIAKDGHPLDQEEARKEAEKYRKTVDARDRETSGQRDRRVRKYEEERQFLNEIPQAFDVKLLGKETLDGRTNWVIALTPKAGYVPQSRNAKIFPNIEGKLWVDQQDLRWTRAVATVIDAISFGWILARIGPGACITMKQVKVDGGHWMPSEIDVKGAAKILLVKNRTVNETISYEDYRRFRPEPAAAAAENR